MPPFVTRILIAAGIAAFAYGGGFVTAARLYSDNTRIKFLQGEIDRLKDDNIRRANAESSARAAVLMLEKERNEDKDHYDALIEELEARTDRTGCGLSVPDANRLLGVKQ